MADIVRIHESHELHPLRFQVVKKPYNCNGCKQTGSTTCFKCDKPVCDFYLHKECFLAADIPQKQQHQLMDDCVFEYHESPPREADRGGNAPYCDACGMDIQGFRYECITHPDNPHDLHPTCMKLKHEMEWQGWNYKLQDKVESRCLHCNKRYPAEECKRFTGWKWVCDKSPFGFPLCFSGRKNVFHVKCMSEIMAPGFDIENYFIQKF